MNTQVPIIFWLQFLNRLPFPPINCLPLDVTSEEMRYHIITLLITYSVGWERDYCNNHGHVVGVHLSVEALCPPRMPSLEQWEPRTRNGLALLSQMYLSNLFLSNSQRKSCENHVLQITESGDCAWRQLSQSELHLMNE